MRSLLNISVVSLPFGMAFGKWEAGHKICTHTAFPIVAGMLGETLRA